METIDSELSEAIAKWKDGQTVWSAELGGLGPGYEQAIQILLWEILATWNGGKLQITDDKYPEEYKNHSEEIIKKLDKVHGFSGAQVGAARRTAFQFLHYGYLNMLSKLEFDRKIQVSKHFPTGDQ